MAEIGANPAIYRTCIEFFCETLKYIFRVRFGSNAKMKTDFGKRKDKDIQYVCCQPCSRLDATRRCCRATFNAFFFLLQTMNQSWRRISMR